MIKAEARELNLWALAHAGQYGFLAKDLPERKPDPFEKFCDEVSELLDDPKVLGSQLEDDIMEINNLSVIASQGRSKQACVDLAQALRRAYIRRHGSRKEKSDLESAGDIIKRIFTTITPDNGPEAA